MAPRRSREDVRECALKAALARFAACGYEATSIQAIADDVGMSKQALMHHFPTKASLREGVYAQLATRFAAASPLLSASIQAEQPSVDVIDVFAAAFEAQPDIARFFVRELLDNPEPTATWLWERGAPIFDVVEESSTTETSLDLTAHAIAVSALLLTNATFLRDVRPEWQDRVRAASSLMLKRGSDPKFPFDDRTPTD